MTPNNDKPREGFPWWRLAVVAAVSVAAVVVLVLIWQPPGPGIENGGGEFGPQAGEVSDSLPVAFAGEEAESSRQVDIELLQENPDAELSPRWDSVIRGLPAEADSASMAIKFRQTDSLMEAGQ